LSLTTPGGRGFLSLIKELKEIDPAYVIPTHCTGRDAIMQIEKEMPEKFILNMAGTKFIFSGIQKENLWKTNYNHGLIFG
jgi:7,8-dihydropterin-6-yl-methyl-4-(beta-D-ribofuranosyl)aminobenzene 5'-phosphate synthase